MISVAVSDVGRAGAVKLPVLLVSGQMSRPHARSVGQQPPPRETGQDRKPGEHIRVEGGVELLRGVSVIVADAEALESDSVGSGGTIKAVVVVSTVVVGRGAAIDVVVVVPIVMVDLLDVLELGEGVGVTTTTAVEVAMHPS